MLVVPSRLYRTESVHTQSLRYADLTRSSCCCTSSSTWTIQRSAGAVLLVHRHHSDSAAAGLFSEHEHYSDPAAADAFPGHRQGVFSRRSCHGSALRKSSTRVPLSGDAAQEGGSPREQMGPFECVCVCVYSSSHSNSNRNNNSNRHSHSHSHSGSNSTSIVIVKGASKVSSGCWHVLRAFRIDRLLFLNRHACRLYPWHHFC